MDTIQSKTNRYQRVSETLSDAEMGSLATLREDLLVLSFQAYARFAEKWINVLDVRQEPATPDYPIPVAVVQVEFKVTLSTKVSRWLKRVYLFPWESCVLSEQQMLTIIEMDVDNIREDLRLRRQEFKALSLQERGE